MAPGTASEISRLERADALGLAFVRTIIVLNSGAILALLTFLANADTQATVTLPLSTIRYSMGSFLVGTVAALLGIVTSYTYTASSPHTGWSHWWDRHLIKTNAMMAVISIGGFVSGVSIILIGATAP